LEGTLPTCRDSFAFPIRFPDRIGGCRQHVLLFPLTNLFTDPGLLLPFLVLKLPPANGFLPPDFYDGPGAPAPGGKSRSLKVDFVAMWGSLCLFLLPADRPSFNDTSQEMCFDAPFR